MTGTCLALTNSEVNSQQLASGSSHTGIVNAASVLSPNVVSQCWAVGDTGVRSSQGLTDLLSSEHRSSAQLSPQMFYLCFMLQQDYLGSSVSLAFPAESTEVVFKTDNIFAPSFSCKVGKVTGERRGESGISQKKRPKNTCLNEFKA